MNRIGPMQVHLDLRPSRERRLPDPLFPRRGGCAGWITRAGVIGVGGGWDPRDRSLGLGARLRVDDRARFEARRGVVDAARLEPRLGLDALARLEAVGGNDRAADTAFAGGF